MGRQSCLENAYSPYANLHKRNQDACTGARELRWLGYPIFGSYSTLLAPTIARQLPSSIIHMNANPNANSCTTGGVVEVQIPMFTGLIMLFDAFSSRKPCAQRMSQIVATHEGMPDDVKWTRTGRADPS